MPNATLSVYSFTADVSQVLNPAVLRAPNSVTPSRRETWEDQVAANGYLDVLYRESAVGVIADRQQWEIVWEAAPEATRAAVRALSRLTGTYSFVHPTGALYTVLTVPGEWREEEATDKQLGTLRFWNLTLVVAQP